MNHHKHCRVKGCEQKLYAASYCKTHYKHDISKEIFKEAKINLCKNCGHEIAKVGKGIYHDVMIKKKNYATKGCKCFDCTCTNPEPEVIEVLQ